MKVKNALVLKFDERFLKGDPNAADPAARADRYFLDVVDVDWSPEVKELLAKGYRIKGYAFPPDN